MKKNNLLAIVPIILVASLIGTIVGHVDAPSLSPRAQISGLNATIGSGELPSWDADAQVKLGWIFNDPYNPQDSTPIAGWDTAVGEIPVWNYDATGELNNLPAQWYIRIPNVDNDNPMKKFWMVWVYKVDPDFQGTETETNIDWYPFENYDNYVVSSDTFDSNGNPTSDVDLITYTRMTFTVDMYPNPEYEDIWLGVHGNQYVTEFYVETFCVIEVEPEPVIIGPGELPDWHEDAQVQLGWIFDDPTNPQVSAPLEGWDTAIGDVPVWNYEPSRTIPDPMGGIDPLPAQWYIQVPNVNEPNPLKKVWISWIYEFDPALGDPQAAINIDWDPNEGMDPNSGYMTEEWYTSEGIPTGERSEAAYVRMTGGLDIFPNPAYEDIWLGTYNGLFAREVYFKTICVEEEPGPGPTSEIVIDVQLGIHYGEELTIDAGIFLDNENMVLDIDVTENSDVRYRTDIRVDFEQYGAIKYLLIIVDVSQIDNPEINAKIKLVIDINDNSMNIKTAINQNGGYQEVDMNIDINLGINPQ